MVLPLFYGLLSTSRSLSDGNFCAMDSGANIFIFPPTYVLPGTLAPSLHCLTSATSGPAHVPLHSAEVIFGMRDSDGCMRRFRQHAFIHADLPFALFPLSALGARGCFFEFCHEIGLQCGSIILPFSLTDGLYLAKLYTLSLDDFSPCDDFTFDTTVLVAQTRSTALVLPDVAVLPIPFYIPFAGFCYSVSCSCFHDTRAF